MIYPRKRNIQAIVFIMTGVSRFCFQRRRLGPAWLLSLLWLALFVAVPALLLLSGATFQTDLSAQTSEEEAGVRGEASPAVDTNVPPGPATVYRVPIEGMVDLGMAPFVSRVIEEASSAENGVVLLDINTFGGRVDAAVMIRDELIGSPVRTIAFINPRAISAGALISLACETIAMTDGGTVGAATPITGGGTEEPEVADEKFMSYMRTEMRSTAERRGRPGDVAEAMVDPDVEVEGVSEKGKVLTLTTDDALRVQVADFQAKSVEDVLGELGLADAVILDRSFNWAETMGRAVSNPILSSFLLSIGFLGIMLELYQPGWGIPGTLGIACLLIFFFGHQVVHLARNEEILLFVLGVALLLLELFVIPGFGIFGISGLAIILVAVFLSLIGLDFRVSWDLGFVNRALVILSSSILMTLGGGFLIFRLLPATGVTGRFVLKTALRREAGFSSHATEKALPQGTTGTALTDLRPAGKVRAKGRRLDAVSEGGFIQVGAKVVIVSWRSGEAVVRQQGSHDEEFEGDPTQETNQDEEAS